MRRAALPASVLSTILACAHTTPASAPARPDTAGWVAFEAEDGKYGFKDSSGKIVLPPRYGAAYDFTPGGLACVVALPAGEWVCIDGRGAEVLRPYIHDNGPDDASEGLARFVEGGKLGFYDTGAKVIPARFEFVTPFTEQRAAFCVGCTKKCDGEHCGMVGGRWGLIDRTGAEICAARFTEIGPFENGTARATEDGAEQTIDLHCNPVPN
jgi:hypothetical protein